MFCNADEDKEQYINIQSITPTDSGNAQPIKIQLFNCDNKLFSISSFFFNCMKFDRIFDKIENELKEKGYLKYSVRKEFDDWKNKYNTTMAFPFNNLELLMNLAQDLEIKMGTSFLGKQEDIKKTIEIYLNVIEEKLQEVDEYYKSNMKVERKYRYADIFRECPVVDWLRDILKRNCKNNPEPSVLEAIYRVAISQRTAAEVDSSFQ